MHAFCFLSGIYERMNYKWERYWIPRDKGNIDFSGNGFPLDPKHELSEYIDYLPKPLSDYREIPCLVLLGEPGMGKSTILEKEYSETKASLSTSQNKIQRIDLKSYSNEDRLVKDIFESDVYISWMCGSHDLYLFLDSFDECRLRIETLHSIILRELQKITDVDIKRLKIRIACRSAVWPKSFEEGLEGLFDAQKEKDPPKFLVLELVPLCERDVVEAASAEGLDVVEFLAEIKKHSAQSFAARPITFGFLINLFRKNREFPENKNDLFRQGLLELVKEDNRSRLETGRTGVLNASQRYALAGRVAFITLFANKPSLRMENISGENNLDCLVINSIYGENETDGKKDFEINLATIKEVLDTGLFSAKGASLLGFAHQQHQEFLAADFIYTKNININKVCDILFIPVDGKRKVIPQLREVATWLAGMNCEFFLDVAAESPEIIMQTNAFIPNDDMKKRLVIMLLELNDRREIASNLFNGECISRLAFPGLADILIQYINDRSKSLEARLSAIRLATAESSPAIAKILIELAGNTSEVYYLRSSALNILSHCPLAEEHYQSLKGFLLFKIAEDNDDDLKGYLFKILWPNHLMPEELFALLSKPTNTSYIGRYSVFLRYDLPNGLGKEHVLPGISWLREVRLTYDDHYFHPLRDAIISTALVNIQDSDIRGPLIDYFSARTNDLSLYLHESRAKMANYLSTNPALRNLFLTDYLSRPTTVKNMPLSGWTLASFLGLVDKDIPWLIDQVKSSVDLRMKNLRAGLIPYVFRPESSLWNDLLIRECAVCEELRNEMNLWLEAVDLNSEMAEQARRNIHILKAREEPDIKTVEKDKLSQINSCVAQLKGGDFFAWCKLGYWFSFEIMDQRFVQYEHTADITSGHFWKTMDDFDKEQIISAIPAYINQVNPEKQDKIAWAGYKGLALLQRMDPEKIDQIDGAAWAKWSYFILSYSHVWPIDGDEHHNALLKLVYGKAPAQFLDDIKKILQKEIPTEITSHKQLKSILDERVVSLMIELFDEQGISSSAFGDLLSFLLDAKRKEAYRYCEDVLEQIADGAVAEFDKCMIVAAAELIIRRPRYCWAKLNLVDGVNEVLAKELIEVMAVRTGYRQPNYFAKLDLDNDDQAKLYVWLATKYPEEEDPIHIGGYTPRARDYIVDAKNEILNGLSNAGTNDALNAIKLICQKLPQYDWLRRVYLRAREEVLRKSWVPVSPEQLNEWVAQPSLRYIQDADQLLEVVLGFIGNYQKHILNSSSKARLLWSEVKESRKVAYTPKDEDALSDHIKDYLSDNLKGKSIILNREVQVTKGQRTDIKIDAIKYEGKIPVDILTVIIEVKGCWNSGLKTAIETQLLNDYLKKNALTHGIYLVGWYLCDKWEENHLKGKGGRQFEEFQEAQEFFEKRAQELSTEDYHLAARLIDLRLN